MSPKSVVLGVCGSVAAYRAADLARELMRNGCTVRVCLTDSAQNFVTSSLFEALTGQPCLQSTFDEPEIGRMAHIDWAREAALLVIAPASANTMAKIANGIADDMLSTIALVYDGPLIIAPAMNPTMYAQGPIVQARTMLESRAAVFVDPDDGDAVCGEVGQGKLAPIGTIVEACLTVLSSKELLKGKRVLITSGPTQEPIDGVRYLTNRSSGKMGASLARAALLMGAEVTVVAGPSSTAYPLAAQVMHVRTAQEMLAASKSALHWANVLVAAAAVADYRPSQTFKGKIRRSDEMLKLDLIPNPDILATLAKDRNAGTIAIGFAAEPDNGIEVAKNKIISKGIDAIAVNDVGRSDVGFETEDNELALVFADGRVVRSGKVSKLKCAMWLFEQIFQST